MIAVRWCWDSLALRENRIAAVKDLACQAVAVAPRDPGIGISSRDIWWNKSKQFNYKLFIIRYLDLYCGGSRPPSITYASKALDQSARPGYPAMAHTARAVLSSCLAGLSLSPYLTRRRGARFVRGNRASARLSGRLRGPRRNTWN